MNRIPQIMNEKSHTEAGTPTLVNGADQSGCTSGVHACPNRLFAVRRGKVPVKEPENREICGSCVLTCPMNAVTLPQGWPVDTTRLKGGAGHC